MPIEFFCQSCHTKLRTPSDTAGKMVRCPVCGQLERIPSDHVIDSEISNAGTGATSAVDRAFESTYSGAPTSSAPASPSKEPISFPSNATNPYSRPTTDNFPPNYRYEPTGEHARQKLSLPGIFMIVQAIIGVLLGGFILSAFLISVGNRGVQGDELFGAIYGACVLLLSLVALLGGIAMVRRKNYSLAIGGTIAMAFLGFTCCFLPMPVAVWSLVVLLGDDVRSLF